MIWMVPCLIPCLSGIRQAGPPFLLSARRRRENLPEKIRICIAVWRPAVQLKQALPDVKRPLLFRNCACAEVGTDLPSSLDG